MLLLKRIDGSIPKFDHHPLLHKKHHKFTSPITFTSLYSITTELVFADMVSIIAPLALYSTFVQLVHIFVFATLMLVVYLIRNAEQVGMILCICLLSQERMICTMKNMYYFLNFACRGLGAWHRPSTCRK